MRTTVDLPDDLFRRAKAAAAMRGVKLKDLIASCLERSLGPSGEQQPMRIERKLPSQVRRKTGKPIPALRNAEIEEILIDEDARR